MFNKTKSQARIEARIAKLIPLVTRARLCGWSTAEILKGLGISGYVLQQVTAKIRADGETTYGRGSVLAILKLYDNGTSVTDIAKSLNLGVEYVRQVLLHSAIDPTTGGKVSKVKIAGQINKVTEVKDVDTPTLSKLDRCRVYFLENINQNPRDVYHSLDCSKSIAYRAKREASQLLMEREATSDG